MRLQILHLPAAADDYPFALIVDEAPGGLGNARPLDDRAFDELRCLQHLRDNLGAKAVVVFPGTVEVV